MEALIFLMGLVSLGYGIVNGASMSIFFGVFILSGSVVLYFVKKKDWKKHWEEQEAIRQRLDEIRKREQEERKR
jgi:poly-gamma-glutamate capsule biosynthesis protein CapA/YwtB (metallophosphatase superfamily)